MIANQIKTFVLLSVLTAFLLFIGQILGGNAGLIIGLIFALVMNFGSYFFSDKIVLSMYRAKKATKTQYSQLHAHVKDLCEEMKLPKPQIWIIPSQSPNAFATGRNPQHGSVAFTEGILELLDADELRGVIAHELAHIQNRDILIQTIASTIAGVISYVASMAQWAAIFGGFGRDRDSGNMIQLLFLAIVAPLIATIIQLAISRQREFMADAAGAKACGRSDGLVSALKKLEKGVAFRPMAGNGTTASMFIINPFSAQGFVKLFSTHPPMSERIAKLRALKF